MRGVLFYISRPIIWTIKVIKSMSRWNVMLTNLGKVQSWTSLEKGGKRVKKKEDCFLASFCFSYSCLLTCPRQFEYDPISELTSRTRFGWSWHFYPLSFLFAINPSVFLPLFLFFFPQLFLFIFLSFFLPSFLQLFLCFSTHFLSSFFVSSFSFFYLSMSLFLFSLSFPHPISSRRKV